MRRFQNVAVSAGGVRVAALHSQVPRFDRSHVTGQAYDQEREHQTHPEYRHEHAYGQEDTAPGVRHLVQVFCVHARVIEREHDLKHDQDRGGNHARNTAVEHCHNECREGDEQIIFEEFQQCH